MKCGMNETNATVKISPLSIKQFRHARTIPILSSIYFRPYIYIYIHTHFMHISIAYGVSLTFVQASPIFPSFLRSMEILEICNIHVSEKERERGRERERQQRNIASLVSILPPISYFSFLSAPLPPPTFVCMSERKKEGRRKKEEKKVASSKLGTGCNTVA